MNISFAWTTEAFKRGLKTETRRDYSDEYASKFHPGDIANAYDKNARNDGKKIGEIKILKVYKQKLGDMTQESFIREGGTMYWKSREEFIELNGGPEKEKWVIRFDKL